MTSLLLPESSSQLIERTPSTKKDTKSGKVLVSELWNAQGRIFIRSGKKFQIVHGYYN